MEILSLNDVYKYNALHYWCNACGDINLPGDGLLWPHNAGRIIHHTEAELPPEAEHLYDRYFSEAGSTQEYVVQFSGRAAYAFGFLFDDDWMKELQSTYDRFRKIAAYVISEKLSIPLFADSAFMYGQATDPDGDEFLIVVPYDSSDRIPAIRQFLWDHDLYKSIEHAVRCLS